MKDLQLTSWSFSRYNTWRLCPLKAKLGYLDKIREPPSAPMERGIRVHNDAERFIKGKTRVLAEELKSFRALFLKLARRYRNKRDTMEVEESWTFTATWAETTWDDWVSAWCRIKLDCAVQYGDELRIYDWKTGKLRDDKNEEYMQQMDLYALGSLLRFPKIQTVEPTLVYVDQDQTVPDDGVVQYTRDDLPRLRKEWEDRVAPMLADKAFPARPNNLCRWCFYRSDNKANGGGQCKY